MLPRLAHTGSDSRVVLTGDISARLRCCRTQCGTSRVQRIRALRDHLVADALTLSRDAQVMMFDEPLNGVDILTRKQVVDEIIRNRENGRTMIISTHLVDELNAYIDVAIFMKNGVLERIGDRAALEEKHGSLTNLYLSIYGGKEDEKHVEAAEV